MSCDFSNQFYFIVAKHTYFNYSHLVEMSTKNVKCELCDMTFVTQKDKSYEIKEQGDILYFYRSKIDSEEVKELEDVGRFYMVTSSKHGTKNDIHRLFLLGQKQLPEIVEGKSTSKERNWALNILTTSNAEDIHKELMPAKYTTETR